MHASVCTQVQPSECEGVLLVFVFSWSSCGIAPSKRQEICAVHSSLLVPSHFYLVKFLVLGFPEPWLLSIDDKGCVVLAACSGMCDDGRDVQGPETVPGLQWCQSLGIVDVH